MRKETEWPPRQASSSSETSMVTIHRVEIRKIQSNNFYHLTIIAHDVVPPSTQRVREGKTLVIMREYSLSELYSEVCVVESRGKQNDR